MVTDYFLPRSSGGVERAVYEVARNLVETGHHVTVLTLRKQGEPSREKMKLSPEAMAGIDVIRVAGWDLSGRLGAQVAVSLHAWPAIWRELSTGRYDLVHAHSIFFHESLVAAVVCRLKKLPLVTTAHLGAPDELGGKVALATSVFEKTIGRIILRRSDAVIAVSQAVGDHVLQGMRHRERLHVIPNGVDLARFRPALQDEAGASGGGPVRILVVGRLIFNKGPQFVLEAAPQVLARFPDARFVFAGDGPMEDELRQEASKRGIAANVDFLGHRDDIPELLASASMAVRPSLSEGLPLVALEAMAAGLPVIATDVGGTREVVTDGETGYLLQPNDVAGLARRICDLAADAHLRSKMGARGREFVEQGYDWSRIAERTVEVYEQVLADDHRR
jgi:glycosyltransferase involved in cell wall biosynthesis